MSLEEIDWRPDHTNSISSATGRLVYAGARAAQVQPTATSKTQIAALLDLLDLHLSGVDCGTDVDRDRVALRIPNLGSEARGALGTLIDAMADGPNVELFESTGGVGWSPATVGWHPEDDSEYARWPGLLGADLVVPDLVFKIVDQSATPELRAYPMLSTQGAWSLRVEGLEVGQATPDRVVLKVGRDGKTGNQSMQRRAWIAATGHDSPLTTDSASTAASLISSFAQQWRSLALTTVDQNEHALESRILRGATPIAVSGRSLSLIQPDSVVNWGSQFPTKWGQAGSRATSMHCSGMGRRPGRSR